MLLVKTQLGMSAIDGIGLFAAQFIPRGSRVWQWSRGFDLRVSARELESLAFEARQTFLRYSYLSKRSGLYVLCFDNARFLNHCEKPNLIDESAEDSEEGLDIAARDIEPGEELTSDYRDFDNETGLKMKRS